MNSPGKLTILATIPSGYCFGLQHVTVDFFSRFPPGVKSHFLLTKWGNGEMEALLKKNGIPYSFSWLGMFSRKMNRLNIKMSIHALLKLPRLYLDFIRLQKKLQPDILYFANHHELILLYPVLLFSKRKIVCHMHDPAPVIDFQKKTFKRYGKLVHHFIAISESVRMRTMALGCPPEKIVTIHNGISIPRNINTKRENELAALAGWDPGVFIIGITGQMTATKGHSDLLDAFKQVHRNNPAVRLIIGGKQLEPLFSELTNAIRESGLEKLVFFTGWLSDVSVFFRNIDVFVLASRHEEGYGLVVAEAMSYKVPVVITNSGGAVEIVEDGKSGYVVPKAGIAEMAARLQALAADAALRTAMGERARTEIEQNFNINTQTTQLVNCLFKIAGK